MTKETNFLILSSESKSEIEISKPFKSSSPIRGVIIWFNKSSSPSKIQTF